jgi:hypothetical protein
VNALSDHVWGLDFGQDRVWAQVAGIAPDRAVRRLLVALNFQAFVDESESAGREMVLAGHIATAEAWAAFSKDWGNMLQYGGRKADGTQHFKMSQMASRADLMDRVPLFSSVIEKHVQISISCRLNLADFKKAHEK